MPARGLSFVSWNIDNLAPALGLPAKAQKSRAQTARAPTPSLAEIASQLGSPDVLCLQEIRIRPEDHAAIVAMVTALPGYTCHYALANDRTNVSFRGGRMYGVATYVRASLSPSWLPHPSWDREGRIVLLALEAAQLAIANVYAVNGSDKPYFDHELGRFEGDRHAFKRCFQKRLLEHLSAQRAADRQLVLLGDWNVSRTKLDTYPRLRTEAPHALARALFNDTFMPALDVVDVFRELHPDARKYTWFNRMAGDRRLDAARVDFALVSRTLLPRVLEADIDERPELRFHSDHAPVRLRLGAGDAKRPHEASF